MRNTKTTAYGIELLVEKYRKDFWLPENTDYYQENDYKEAERKYIKLCLNGTSDY
jgi:hypothetical protein